MRSVDVSSGTKLTVLPCNGWSVKKLLAVVSAFMFLWARKTQQENNLTVKLECAILQIWHIKQVSNHVTTKIII